MSKQVMDLEAQLATMRATMTTLQGQMDALQAQVARADSPAHRIFRRCETGHFAFRT
eukprot:COSAG02_NODE_21479_length_786_cov_1.259098_2_plen_56_part_01